MNTKKREKKSKIFISISSEFFIWIFSFDFCALNSLKLFWLLQKNLQLKKRLNFYLHNDHDRNISLSDTIGNFMVICIILGHFRLFSNIAGCFWILKRVIDLSKTLKIILDRFRKFGLLSNILEHSRRYRNHNIFWSFWE